MFAVLSSLRQTLSGSTFKSDGLWNVISFAFCGVVGVFLNVLILNFSGSEALGIFNIVYACFILLSQISTFGIHLSTQKYVPRFRSSTKNVDTILTAAIFAVFPTALFTLVVSYALRNLPSWLMGSQGITVGFTAMLPALLFFSFNKVLLAYHNGLRRMKALALFNSLRFVFLLAGLWALVLAGVDSSYFGAIFTISEGLLFVVLSLFTVSGVPNGAF